MVVPTDLTSKFKDFDKSNDLRYDILNNSGTYFRNLDEQEIIKTIKQFINKLI